jgi:hypothetical protein
MLAPLGVVIIAAGWVRCVVTNVGPTLVQIVSVVVDGGSVRCGHGWNCSSRSEELGGWSSCRFGNQYIGSERMRMRPSSTTTTDPTSIASAIAGKFK